MKPERFKINPIKILNEYFTDDSEFDSTGHLVFTIHKGIVELHIQDRDDYGSSNTRYAIHPNGVCEGKGICIYCGRTLFEND